jgi:hypothetical protein
LLSEPTEIMQFQTPTNCSEYIVTRVA